MGFERKRKLYRLDFTGTDLDGLEVDVRGLSMEEYLRLSGLAKLADVKVPTPEELEELRSLFELFASKIDRWNLEEDGQPVRVCADAVMGWEAGEVLAAVEAWQKAVTDVPAPLEQPSPAGRRWVGEPIPMDVPSPNLSSLPTPA